MSRRSGVTLVEVLVAIFIMGIGMLALLTLFPIGILRMGQAIRYSRTSTAAYNAGKVANFQDIRNDLGVIVEPNDIYNNGATNNDVFANPCPNFPAGPLSLLSADLYSESYPIFVDPIGWFAAVGINQHWVGQAGSEGVLRRRPVDFVTRNGVGAIQLNILRSFTLWDDMVWESTTAGPTPPGTPQTAPIAVLRDSRFSWAYVLRRPQTADRSIVDCTVVVFDQRTLSLTQSQSLPEYVYRNMAYFNTANNTITVEYTSPTVIPPPVRPGQWIMDATAYTSSLPGALIQTGSASANFYRVVAAEDFVVGAQKFVRFEVQGPIRGPISKYSAPLSDPLGTGATVFKGTVIVMEGIADVFEKGPARLP